MKEAKATVELKPMRTGLIILELGVIVALLLGYEALVAVRIITATDWNALLGFGLLFGSFFLGILLIINVLFIAAFVGATRRGGYFRAMARRDPSLVSVASPQPDRTLALSNGETLTIAYRRLRSEGRQIPTIIIFSLIIAALGEALIFAALPVFGRSALNPFNIALLNPPTTATPTLVDWVVAAFPLVIGVALIITVIVQAVTTRTPLLTADDAGITLWKGRRRTSIPWNDIVLFAHTNVSAPSSPLGSYILWGRTHRLGISVIGPRGSERFEDSDTQAQATRYDFEGGYETYLANVQRLFATITTRANTPLLTMREASFIRAIRRRAPTMTTSADDARDLPLAGSEWQPHSGATLAFGEQLALKARLALLPILGESLLWMVAIGAFTIPFVRQPDFLNALFAVGPIVGVIAIAFCIALLGLVAVAFAIQRRRNALPAITIDGFGLTARATSGQKPGMVPWQSVTAWVVIPAPPGSRRPTRYIVFGEGQKIAWAESADARLAGRDVKGDRQQAYREQAARIHALIAARTGLPLRELRVDAVPMSGQQQSL
jgi:hypothetical protein